MHRLAPVLHVLGLVILIFSFTMLAPLLTAFFAHDAAQHAFDESFAATLVTGFALWLAGRRWRRELKVRDGFLPVLLAALNFVAHFLAFHQRSLAACRHDPEVRGLLGLAIASCLGISLYVWQAGTYPELLAALRQGSFNLASLATDCGFASTDFNTWPMFAPMWMLFLSCITASSGSTGGGIKMIRAVLIFRQGVRELEHQLHPAARLPVKIGGHAVPNQIVFAVQAFVMMYVATIVTITLVLLASGLDFVSAFSAVIACINNAGPGLNEVGPGANYAGLNDFQTWALAFTMLLGRLELFTVFVLFTRAFWRT